MQKIFPAAGDAVRRLRDPREGMAAKACEAAGEAEQWLKRLAGSGQSILETDGRFMRGLLVTLLEKIWV